MSTTNRISGGSFLSDDEFVVIKLGEGGDLATTNGGGGHSAVVAKPPEERTKRSSLSDGGGGGNTSSFPSSSGSNTQIQRITMKKEAKNRKKDSVASIVIDTKESLRTPLIVQTHSIDSESEEPEVPKRKLSTTYLTPLNKTDLPRSLRSTRRLSACNEQVLMELQQHQKLLQKQPSDRSNSIVTSSQRSSLNIEENDKVTSSVDAKIIVANMNDSSTVAVTKASTNPNMQTKSLSNLNRGSSSICEKPIWGQFHFFPNGSMPEMNSRLLPHPLPSTSFTTFATSGSAILSTAGDFQPPIILLPSSYDLAEKGDNEGEGCFNIILLCGSLILLGTISAAVGLIFGFI